MYDKLCELLKPPPPDDPGEGCIWTDGHISGQLLRTHLDPDTDLASRKPGFMDRSARWIGEMNPPGRFPRLLDLGCGPGLYAQRFVRDGYAVTGIDISARSIEYARESARAQGLSIEYIHADYLSAALPGPFDLAVMIWCDYGALNAAQRGILMKKAYGCLRPGGRFLLDVHSLRLYDTFMESHAWETSGGGFWAAEPYLVFNAGLKYPEHTTLYQAAVITRDCMKRYNIWNHCFSPEGLAGEAVRAGFRVLGCFSDVAGASYAEDSDTLALLLEK